MGYEFRPAVRDKTSVIVGLAGQTGSGKTFSALRLATGLAGNGKIAFIDTERGRGLHYAPPPGVTAELSRGTFAFNYLALGPPFSPDAYLGAIKAADEAGHPVIIVDSFSHEWEGEGGVLEMQEAEFERMGSREQVKLKSWIKPKGDHKRMVRRLIQCSAHLIICMRAQEKVKIVKDERGKQQIIQASDRPPAERWEPICEKRFPHELTASFVLSPAEPGIPITVKLQDQHRALFPLDRKIDEEAGAALAAWATGRTGGAAAPKPAPSTAREAPLTRGDVKQLEYLIETARKGDALSSVDGDLLERAITNRDAGKVREGIRELSAKLGLEVGADEATASRS